MRASYEFLLGLLDRENPAVIAAEDWDGVHGPALRLWQEMGFLDKEPSVNPVPTCPHCERGVPYSCAGRLLCNHCRSTVDARHLHLWRLHLSAFLVWVAGQWRLQGGVRRITDELWQLGTLQRPGAVHECFYCRGTMLSEAGESRITAYRQALVLHGAPSLGAACRIRRPHIYLPELLREGPHLCLADPSHFLRPRGIVRFDAGSGVLWAGDTWLGEVPLDSREYVFLDRLARDLDQVVPYSDLKRAVLLQTGSRDGTDEATFCHRLKNRLKKKGFVPAIDRLVVTTHKGNGYRLRGHLEQAEER